jgi:hypothetical protein
MHVVAGHRGDEADLDSSYSKLEKIKTVANAPAQRRKRPSRQGMTDQIRFTFAAAMGEYDT